MRVALFAMHGVLAAASVIASVLGVQARTPGRARQMGSALAAIVIAQTVVGNVLYPHYLRNAKPTLQALAAGARSAADVFEVKEHLAFVALVLALGAFAATRRDPRPTVFVRSLFGAAHGAILLVAVLGLVVASLKTP